MRNNYGPVIRMLRNNPVRPCKGFIPRLEFQGLGRTFVLSVGALPRGGAERPVCEVGEGGPVLSLELEPVAAAEGHRAAPHTTLGMEPGFLL